MASPHPDRRQKAKYELVEMTLLFGYLAFFFCALALYDLLLLRQYHVKYLEFAFALINALVVTKVVMIGEYVKLGRRHEHKSLFASIVWKALIFAVLVFAFHVVEEVIKRLVHGGALLPSIGEVEYDRMAARAIVVFCVFLSLFTWRELRRVLGNRSFDACY